MAARSSSGKLQGCRASWSSAPPVCNWNPNKGLYSQWRSRPCASRSVTSRQALYLLFFPPSRAPSPPTRFPFSPSVSVSASVSVSLSLCCSLSLARSVSLYPSLSRYLPISAYFYICPFHAFIFLAFHAYFSTLVLSNFPFCCLHVLRVFLVCTVSCASLMSEGIFMSACVRTLPCLRVSRPRLVWIHGFNFGTHPLIFILAALSLVWCLQTFQSVSSVQPIVFRHDVVIPFEILASKASGLLSEEP